MSWDLHWDADEQPRIVPPEEGARAAAREIDDGWRRVADESSAEDLVRWVLAVGEKHGHPLDEDWVRWAFTDLHRDQREERGEELPDEDDPSTK